MQSHELAAFNTTWNQSITSSNEKDALCTWWDNRENVDMEFMIRLRRISRIVIVTHVFFCDTRWLDKNQESSSDTGNFDKEWRYKAKIFFIDFYVLLSKRRVFGVCDACAFPFYQSKECQTWEHYHNIANSRKELQDWWHQFSTTELQNMLGWISRADDTDVDGTVQTSCVQTWEENSAGAPRHGKDFHVVDMTRRTTTILHRSEHNDVSRGIWRWRKSVGHDPVIRNLRCAHGSHIDHEVDGCRVKILMKQLLLSIKFV